MRKKKNILLILTDQQRKDSLGCYGNQKINTPNLDQLAENGVIFERCYVANPICMPNRLSLFTGMYPRNHGLWTNGLLLDSERPTLTAELKKHGYQTASIGKIHFTPYGGNEGNLESKKYWDEQGDNFDWDGPYWGFDHVELTIGHTAPVAHYGRWFRQNGGKPEMLQVHKVSGAMQSGVREMPAELHDSAFVAERTIEYLKNRDQDKPFFTVASFPDPHHPFDPPAEYAGKYNPENVNQPIGGEEDLDTRPEHYRQHFHGGWHRKGAIPEAYPNGISEEHRNELIAHTYAMVDQIDHNIGKILDYLEAEGLMEDTVIIFTSDHGELLGDHGLWFKGPFFYDGLINIPLIISAPNCVKPFKSEQLISTIDILPTIFDLLDLPIPEFVNGVSQKEHLHNPLQQIRDKCLVEYRNGYGCDCATNVLITKDYKFVRYENGECELTDLVEDSKETINVAEHNPDTVQRMNNMLLQELLATQSKWPKQISHA